MNALDRENVLIASDAKPFRHLATRFVSWLKDRFFLRFHMSLILVGVVLVGFWASKLLWVAGLDSMAIRYGLVVGIGYLFFFFGVKLWLGYVLARCPMLNDPNRPIRLESPQDASSDIFFNESGSSAPGRTIEIVADIATDDGMALIMLFITALLLLLGSGVFLIWQAPAVLSEVALQAVLALCLRKRAKAMDAPDWKGSVLRTTWKPALTVLFAAVVIGLLAQLVFPQAETLSEVFHSIF